MKTIGLLGGMSWESTVTYYQIINQEIAARLGGLHSARCLLYSVDFDEIERLQSQGDWDRCAEILSEAALTLQQGGADFLVICTNTMHKIAPQIEAKLSIPLLHIADATVSVLQQQGVSAVGLLGTRYTMQQEFYRGRLTQQGIRVLLPSLEEMDEIHRIIFEELCLGIIRDESRQTLVSVIHSLAEQGVGGVILGCTELGLILSDVLSPVWLFDTAKIHAQSAARLAISSINI